MRPKSLYALVLPWGLDSLEKRVYSFVSKLVAKTGGFFAGFIENVFYKRGKAAFGETKNWDHQRRRPEGGGFDFHRFAGTQQQLPGPSLGAPPGAGNSG
jgi:hypothetical protein